MVIYRYDRYLDSVDIRGAVTPLLPDPVALFPLAASDLEVARVDSEHDQARVMRVDLYRLPLTQSLLSFSAKVSNLRRSYIKATFPLDTSDRTNQRKSLLDQ